MASRGVLSARNATSAGGASAQMPPSPSSGPPLLSESWSPPLFCGMPLDFGAAAAGFGGAAGLDGAAGLGGAAGSAGAAGLDGAAGFVGAVRFGAPPEACFPAGETANQLPPNALTP